MDIGKKYYCKCGVAFTSERSLNFHRGSRACRLREPSAIRFSCSDCKFTAYYQITLDKHRQIRHSSKTPFPCKCGEKFGELEALLQHQETTISCRKYHTCKICGHISPTQGQLNRHFRSHSDEKPFICGCGRAYPRKDSYYRHQRGCPSADGGQAPAPPTCAPEAPRDKYPVVVSAPPPAAKDLPAPGPAAGSAPSAVPIPMRVTMPVSAPAAPGPISVSNPVAATSIPPPSGPSGPLAQSVPSASASGSAISAIRRRDEKLPTMLPPPSTLPHYTRDPHMFPNANSANASQGPLPPPMVQVHSQVFMPHYSGHFVWMNPTPAHPQTDPQPQPNQLLNLSYLASMKRRIDLPVPSSQDVPSLE